MDPATFIFAVFAVAIIVMVVAIPIICTVFTLGVVKKTARFAFKNKSRKK